MEAVRLAKITTGTYNAAGSYKIVYKTNLSGADYRVLADSLTTQQNYMLEASPVALRLASNEYVTEVMFVFSVVPANFRQVKPPKLTAPLCPGPRAAVSLSIRRTWAASTTDSGSWQPPAG